MKQFVKISSLNLMIAILGIGILVAGILIMALQHDMSWQSYVVIGVIMGISVWVMAKTYIGSHVIKDRIPVRHENRYYSNDQE